MDGVAAILFVPIVVFLVIVAPIWIVVHYRYRAKIGNHEGLSDNDRAELDEMIEVANKMAARIETLESILDVESPGWREKQDNKV